MRLATSLRLLAQGFGQRATERGPFPLALFEYAAPFVDRLVLGVPDEEGVCIAPFDFIPKGREKGCAAQRVDVRIHLDLLDPGAGEYPV